MPTDAEGVTYGESQTFIDTAHVLSHTVERAVLCRNGVVHFGPEYLTGLDPLFVVARADLDAANCGPHYEAVRHRIVTRWGRK